MFIPDPGSWFLPIPDPGYRISDPKTATREWGEKKNSCHTFFRSHICHKIVNYYTFERLKKKIWASFQRITELFTHKIVTKLSKIWVWDPVSEIRDPEKLIPDPGSWIQGSKRHRIPDPDPQHCYKQQFMLVSQQMLWRVINFFLNTKKWQANMREKFVYFLFFCVNFLQYFDRLFIIIDFWPWHLGALFILVFIRKNHFA